VSESLDEETTRKVKSIIKESGIKDCPIRIADFKVKGKRKFLYRLRQIARKEALNEDVTELLKRAGLHTKITKRTMDAFIEALREFYPEGKVAKAYEGSDIKFPTIQEFREKHRDYAAFAQLRQSHRELPAFSGIVNSLYPNITERFGRTPSIYEIVTGRIHTPEIALPAISEELRQIFLSGGDISFSGLEREHERLAKIIAILRSHPGKYRMGSNGTQVISNLTGIKHSEFGLGEACKMRSIGKISEDLTMLLMKIVEKTDPSCKYQTESFRTAFPHPIRHVPPSRSCKVLKENGRYFMADIFVDSKEPAVVEVKNVQSLRDDTIKKLVEDLGGDETLYLVGSGSRKEIKRRIVIFHGTEKVVDYMEKKLESPLILSFSGRKFESGLERALESAEGKIKLPCPAEEIMDIYRQTAYSSHFLLKESQQNRLQYARWLISSLCRSISENKPIEKHPVTVFGQHDGEIRNPRGVFQRFAIPLSKFEDSKTFEYVTNNIKNYWTKSKLFFDLETCGLGRNDQIICAGMGYKKGNELMVEVAFARNPWEEAALLQYLDEKIEEHEILITYNGRVFDIPAMNRRTKANLIEAPRISKDIDVYSQHFRRAMRQFGLKNSRLGQIDRLCGQERTDISGREVPRIYREYVYGNADVSPVLEHNARDIISLIAAHIYAKKEQGVKF